MAWPARIARLAAQVRAGSLTDVDATTIAHVLDLVAAADVAVDRAQPLLADLLGVPNPDNNDGDEDEGARAAAYVEVLRQAEAERAHHFPLTHPTSHRTATRPSGPSCARTAPDLAPTDRSRRPPEAPPESKRNAITTHHGKECHHERTRDRAGAAGRAAYRDPDPQRHPRRDPRRRHPR
ncbi:hypothetical protein ABIA39_008887 [Nocardia sp. GAS34]|uniref:hypothetical protein n=1 Tax=unclassified Nocardia TaxID=2637762 RepID=UPI003D22A065